MAEHDRWLMRYRCQIQFAEAFGATNRWFCSEFHHKKIDDKDLLLEYYIKSGGAEDFANRFNEAMGMENRWYCSEFYGREIRDPEILWEYYIEHATADRISRQRQHLAACG